MTTEEYRALPGMTPEEKGRSLGIVPRARFDVRDLAALSARYGMAVYLLFEPDLAGIPLEQVIFRYRDVPEELRPYVRVDGFLRFVQENDPSFAHVMEKDPVMVSIVAMGQIAANPGVPPLVYVTALMPHLDEMKF